MATLFGMFPFLKTLFADSGYQGPKFAKGLAKVLPHLDIEIVFRSGQRICGLAKTLDRGRSYNVDRLNFEWGTFIERGRLSGRSKHQRRQARDVSQFATGELEPSGCLIEHPRLTSRSIAGGGSDGPARGSPSARSARLIRGDTAWSPASDRGVCPSRAADDASHEGQAEALRCSEPACEDENQDGEGR